MGKAKAVRWAAACLLALAHNAGAEVVFTGVRWQLAVSTKEEKSPFRDVSAWVHPPPQGHDSRPRAVATLANRGTLPAGAVVLRYALSAHLVKIDGKDPGTWAIPFVVEDRRIPQAIPADSSRDIPINVNRPALDAYLKRIYRSGFWLDALRIQLELEPRPGETFKDRTLEATLTVDWKPGAQK